jgi:hypothetical protein
MISRLRVETYSGYKSDERPLRFFIRERQFEVVDVVDQWYCPGATYFRVRADDGNLYILRHNESGIEDTWWLESFRRA